MDQSKPVFPFVEWCQRIGISKAKGYLLLHSGEAPQTFLIGTQRFVSVEAEREWLARLQEIPAPLQPPRVRKVVR